VVVVQVAVGHRYTCRRFCDVNQPVSSPVEIHVVDPDVAAAPDGDTIRQTVLHQEWRNRLLCKQYARPTEAGFCLTRKGKSVRSMNLYKAFSEACGAGFDEEVCGRCGR
jgi:hypothetical protein